MANYYKANLLKCLKCCCCCMSIRTSCLLLGYTHMTLNAFDTFSVIFIAKLGLQLQDFDYSEFGFEEEDLLMLGENPRRQINVGFLFIAVICLNIFWLFVSIACLVVLHLNKPGPMRKLVFLAASRVTVLLSGFLYGMLTQPFKPQYMSLILADFGISINFVIVYFVYGAQLKSKASQRQNIKEKETSDHKTKVELQKLV